MERLTYRLASVSANLYGIDATEDNSAKKSAARQIAFDRLAAYEETGLTPEQVAELKERETPKEAIPDPDDPNSDLLPMFKCPVCGASASSGYCENCGQALKWPEPPKERNGAEHI